MSAPRFTREQLAGTPAGRIKSNAKVLGAAAEVTPKEARVTVRSAIWPYRSKVEVRYADLLEVLKRIGEIEDWEYEPEALVIGHRCTVKLDFRVTYPGSRKEWHETKGAFIREDAWIKLKVAATLYPDQAFVLKQWKGGVWLTKVIPPGSPAENKTSLNDDDVNIRSTACLDVDRTLER